MIKFGTDGWRAVMCDQFNLGPVRQVVQAIADHVVKHGGQGRGLVVGYDSRFFSDRFAEEAAAVLAGNGIKVLAMPRDLPTPVVAFAVRNEGAFGAIVFTASHNPPEYNGIKFIPEYAGPASPVITAEIEGFLAQRLAADAPIKVLPRDEAAECGLRVEIDPIPAYLEHLGRIIDRDRIASAGLALVVDPMYGTSRGLFEEFFAGVCRVEVLHGRRDPLFGGRMPDPQQDNLLELAERVRSLPNAVGLATDGDADRFGIIDRDGSFLAPNQVIPLLLVHLLETRRWTGAAARTVATTHLIDRVAAGYGVETLETPVGFKYLGELMRTREVIIAGEESGGLSIRGHLPEKDGVLACALMAEMMATTGRPFRDSLADLHKKFGGAYSRRLDLHMEVEEIGKTLKTFAEDPPQRVLDRRLVEVRRIDGVKCLLDDGSWFLIRPSGTEPLIRAYCEAPGEEGLRDLVRWLQEALRPKQDRRSCAAG